MCNFQILETIYYYGTSRETRNTIMFTILAIITVIVGLWLFYSKAYKYTLLKKRCTYRVQARVFSLDSKFGGKGGRFYNATYEFFFNERRYVISNDIWEKIGSLFRPAAEGSVVDIFINPENPHEIYDYIVDRGRRTGIIGGILMFLVATVIFIVSIKIR